MVASSSTNLTKMNLTERIAKLEADIDKLLQTVTSAGETAKAPPPEPKPADTKPAETKAPPPPKAESPRGSLPKGMETPTPKAESPRGSLPKGMETSKSEPTPEPQVQQTTVNTKSRNDKLEDYEKKYLARLATELKEKIEIQREAEELAAKRSEESVEQVLTTRGSLPKGF